MSFLISMDILLLKLILAPVVIGSTSLASRKWGAAVSGWLVGLPLTSGPVVFILALSHDKAFAADSARGVLSGGFSLIAFCLAYAWISKKYNWGVSIFCAGLVFAAFTTMMQYISIPLIPLFFSVIGVILAGIWLMPKSEMENRASQPGNWDIPARIALVTFYILLTTGIAPYIGARLTGLLTTVPLYASILTVFAHRQYGSAGAINVLRGLVYGLFGFAGFYLILGSLIEQTPLWVSFGAASLTTILAQGISLRALNRKEIKHNGDVLSVSKHRNGREGN